MSNYRLTDPAALEAYACFLDAWRARYGSLAIAAHALARLPEAAPLVGHYKPRGQVIVLANLMSANRVVAGHRVRLVRHGRSYRRTRQGPNVILPSLWALNSVEGVSGPMAAHHGSVEPIHSWQADEETAQ